MNARATADIADQDVEALTARLCDTTAEVVYFPVRHHSPVAAELQRAHRRAFPRPPAANFDLQLLSVVDQNSAHRRDVRDAARSVLSVLRILTRVGGASNCPSTGCRSAFH